MVDSLEVLVDLVEALQFFEAFFVVAIFEVNWTLRLLVVEPLTRLFIGAQGQQSLGPNAEDQQSSKKSTAGWWCVTFIICPYVSIYWECHHPN